MALTKKAPDSRPSPGWKTGLKSKLKELRRVEREAFGPRHGKDDFHGYLKAVYNRWDWADPKVSRWVGRRVAKLCSIDSRKNKSPIRVVIDATSQQDRQTKSRWTRAVEYAVAKGVSRNAFSEFFEFLDDNGGVYGCSRKMAALQKKKLASSAPHRASGW
jgi:hypothetical protein